MDLVKKAIAVIAVFMGILLIPTVLSLFGLGAGFDSEAERRNPADFPEWSKLFQSGKNAAEFFSGVEDYYNDRLPFRSEIMAGYRAADSALRTGYSSFLKTYVPWKESLRGKPDDSSPDTHTHTYEEKVTEPTCTERGYTTHTCSGCGDQYVDSYTEPTGHQYESVTREPTCTEPGYTLHTCLKCSETLKDNEVPATDHTWSEWSVSRPATETEDGTKVRVCTVCLTVQSGIIPKVDKNHVHDYRVTRVKEPTCTETGYTVYTCSGCGDSYESDSKPMKPHTFDKTGTVAPTCTERGYDYRACSVCGLENRSNYKDAAGHTWGEWVITVEPTANKKGERTRTCKVCNGQQKEDLPALVGKTTKNGFVIGGRIDNDPSLSDYEFPNVHGSGVIYGRKDNWLFWSGEWISGPLQNALNDFCGYDLFYPSEMASFAEKLSQLDSLLESKGKKLIFTITPNKESIYGEYMPSYDRVSDVSRTTQMMQYLQSHTKVSVVYPIEKMLEYKETYQLYFKYDTHWNSAGGYVYAMEILRTLGLPATDLYDVELKEVARSSMRELSYGSTLYNGYLTEKGDLGSMVGNSLQKDELDYQIDFMPKVTFRYESMTNRRGENRMFTSPEYTNAVTVSNSSNKQSLCIIGDSFRRAISPFMFKSFEKVSTYHQAEITTDEYFYGTSEDASHVAMSEAFRKNLAEADVILVQGVERCFLDLTPTDVILDRLIEFFKEN